MEDKEFMETLLKMDTKTRDEIMFKALGGKKRTSKYLIDTYYKGLGYWLGNHKIKGGRRQNGKRNYLL